MALTYIQLVDSTSQGSIPQSIPHTAMAEVAKKVQSVNKHSGKCGSYIPLAVQGEGTGSERSMAAFIVFLLL